MENAQVTAESLDAGRPGRAAATTQSGAVMEAAAPVTWIRSAGYEDVEQL